MPSKSKQQQRFFGLVMAVKSGEKSRDEVSQAVIDAADSMTMKQIEDFASTKHKGLRDRVRKKKARKKLVKESRILSYSEFRY